MEATPRSMNTTEIPQHQHRSARKREIHQEPVRRTAGFTLPKAQILWPTEQPNGQRIELGDTHAPPRPGIPPPRRGSLPGARRRTAAARLPGPDTAPNPAPPAPYPVQMQQPAPARGAAPAAGGGGGGGRPWRRRREGGGGGGLRFLGFLEGQLWNLSRFGVLMELGSDGTAVLLTVLDSIPTTRTPSNSISAGEMKASFQLRSGLDVKFKFSKTITFNVCGIFLEY